MMIKNLLNTIYTPKAGIYWMDIVLFWGDSLHIVQRAPK